MRSRLNAALLGGVVLLTLSPAARAEPGPGDSWPPGIAFGTPLGAFLGAEDRLRVYAGDPSGVASVTVTANGVDVTSSFTPTTDLVEHLLDDALGFAAHIPGLPGSADYAPGGPLDVLAVAPNGQVRLRVTLLASGNRGWELELWLVPATGTPRRELPPGDYLPTGPIDPAGWQFLAVDATRSTARGLGAFAGETLLLSPGSLGFQLGTGANGRSHAPGISGSFAFAGPYAGEGELRLELKPTVVLEARAGVLLPLITGSNLLGLEARDSAGNVGRNELDFVYIGIPGGADRDPPVFGPAPDLLVEQTSAAGAVVNYAPPVATDAVDPNPRVTCTPPPGSTFPPGDTSVTCTATDAAGNSATVSFLVTVADRTPPSLATPADLTVEQTGPAGAVVSYPAPAASDAVDPAPSVVCLPASGSTFPPGATVVTCTATDAAGNGAGVSFTVTVVDRTPPSIVQPADVQAEQASAVGAVVTFPAPSVTDAADPTPGVVCVPASGSTFPPGSTLVTCTATDAAGNRASVSFTVRVQDTTAPNLVQPADVRAEQTSPTGAVVAFPAPSVTDAADPAPSVVCVPASGSSFSPGSTLVTCTATDAAGNSASVSFTVRVEDTTPPSIAQPADVPAEQTSAAGAVVSFPGPSVSDLADPNPSVTCTPPSGSSFPPGTTSVTCTATDAAGNSASVSFTVTVADTTPPALSLPADLVVEQTSPAGAVVPYPAPTASDTLDPAPQITCSPASGGVFPAGLSVVDCTARDAAGNVASGAFTITVRDTRGPSLALEPAAGTTLDQPSVTLAADYADAGAGIDPASFRATLDGVDLSQGFSVGPARAEATSGPLADGTHVLVVRIADLAGNELVRSSSFAVSLNTVASFELSVSGDPAALPVAVEQDLNVTARTLSGQVATAFAGTVLIRSSDGLGPLDGLLVPFAAADQGRVSVPRVALLRTIGLVVLSASSLDAPGIAGELRLNVIVEEPTIHPPPAATVGADGVLVVSGFSFPGLPVELLVDGVVVETLTAGVAGSFSFSAVLPPGTHTVQTRASEPGLGTRVSPSYQVSAPQPTATGLRVTPATGSLAVGETLQLVVQQLFDNGSSLDASARAAYQSQDPSVVSVDAAGLVRALAPGQTSLDIAFDGFALSLPIQVGVPVLASSSPQDGEDEVAVTRETILRFSAPLDPASVNSTTVFAEFGGQTLAARVHLSPEEDVVTLFYDAPLPASARVRVSVDGDALLSAAGAPIDADRDGQPGGRATIDFDTLDLALVPGTSVCGRVFASELGLQGGASVNVPLEGVRITVDGAESVLFTTTDALGDFRLDPAPAGRFFVHIDGRTASAPIPPGAYYPFVGKTWTSVPGTETTVGNVHLPLVQAGTLQPVDAQQDTPITFATDVLVDYPELVGVQITVPADSLFANDGTRGGQVGIAPVPPDRLPGDLPPDLNFALVITVQTNGATNFDTPVPVRFPNLEGLPPGAETALWSFNHDTGRFEIVGGMVVTADGQFVETLPGVGILAPGWHGVQNGTSGRGGGMRNGQGGGRNRPGAGDQENTGDDFYVAPCNVFLHNGEESFDKADLIIPGRGAVQFVMHRTYRSQLDYDGPLGHNWTFNYNESLFVEDNGDVMRVNGAAHLDTWTRSPDGSYQAPRGFYGALVREQDGTFVLREPNGFKRFYRSDGRLYCHRDRNGNELRFDYDAAGNLQRVIDPFGREIAFIFETAPDGVERLTRIRDFIGREVVYGYDANGDLVSVRSPVVTGTSTGNDFPDGRTERYGYLSGYPESDPQLRLLNHNIETITFPEEVATGGPPAFVFTYGLDPADPLTFDRVIRRQRGATNASGVPAGGVETFLYERVNESVPLGDLRVPRLRTTFTDRNGNVEQSHFNEAGSMILLRELTRGLRPGEPVAYETQLYYDGDGKLVRKVFPEGNEVRNVYGSGDRASERNLIETRKLAGPRGGGEDIVIRTTYEPLYNRVASTTDPRGNAVAYAPPLGTASRERYTTRFFFDYQEGNDPIPDVAKFGLDISGIARGLGDLNGDGRTDQIAGNVVRTRFPSVQLAADSPEAARTGSTTQEVIAETQWSDRGQVLAEIDPVGSVIEHRYYPENDPDGDGNTTLQVFRPLSSDEGGYERALIVDARISPRRQATTPPAALTTTHLYDRVGNLIAQVNPRGVRTEIEVNQLNEVVQITRGADVSEARLRGQLITGEAALRYRNRKHYDHNARVILEQVDARDSNTPGVGAFLEREYTYDIFDHLVEERVEVDGNTTRVTRHRYDPNENQALTIHPEGNQDRTVYDERDQVFTITRGYGSPEASTSTIAYDGNGNQVRLLDAEDNDGDGLPEETRFVYDGFDRRVETVDALGNRSLVFFDINSKVVRRQTLGHPAGQPGAAPVLLNDVEYRLDELNRIVRRDEALFLSSGFTPSRPVDLRDGDGDGIVSWGYAFDAVSRQTFEIQDDGQLTETVYDGLGRRVATIDALGNRTETTYDANNNPVELRSVERSPDGLVPDQTFVTRQVFDQLDRIVRSSDPGGQTRRYAYDARDNLIATSDAQGPSIADPLGLVPGTINGPGNTVRMFYDGLDRELRRVWDLRAGGSGEGALDTSNPHNPDGQVGYSQVWDGNSRLREVRDDAGNVRSYEYDALDRIVRHMNADGSARVVVYDRDSNEVTVTDPNGSVVTKRYDALHRLVRSEVARASGVVGTTLETYAYDGMSRRTRSVDDNGGDPQIIEYVYDSLSRLLEERQNGAVLSSVWAGDSRKLACVYPGGRRIERSHDAIDRVRQVSEGGSPIATCAWIGEGKRELRRQLANGVQRSYLDDAGAATGYDALKRTARLRWLDAGGTALVDREYAYNRANMRSEELRHDDDGLADRYVYDSTYRVVSARFDAGGDAGATRRDLSDVAYAYDGVGNRREETQVRRSTGSSSQTFAVSAMNEYTAIGSTARRHDANGNLLDDGLRLYAYDVHNRLVAVADAASGAPIARYRYFHDGRRSRKLVFAAGGPGTPDRETVYLYDGWQCVEEQDAGGATEVTYVHGPIHEDDLIQLVRTAAHPLGAATLYPHQNARGDVVALSDAAGAVVERTRYDAFGAPDRISQAGNPYLFQGRRLDAETGLYYFRMRSYDPRTGRFIQRDPILDMDNLGGRYTFVGNGPVSRMDPRGEDWTDWIPDWLAKGHNPIYRAFYGGYKKHQRATNTLAAAGHTGFDLAFNSLGIAISDYTGATSVAEAWMGHDIHEFVADGNIHTLSTGQRIWRGVSGGTQVILSGVGGAGMLGQGRQLLGMSKHGSKVYSVTDDVTKIWNDTANSGRIWGRTEGSVYGMAVENAPRWRTMINPKVGDDVGTLVFTDDAAKLFQPHRVEGVYSGLKRLLGQHKSGFGDIVFKHSDAVFDGTNIIIRNAELAKHAAANQSALWAGSRLWGRRALDMGMTGGTVYGIDQTNAQIEGTPTFFGW